MLFLIWVTKTRPLINHKSRLLLLNSLKLDRMFFELDRKLMMDRKDVGVESLKELAQEELEPKAKPASS